MKGVWGLHSWLVWSLLLASLGANAALLLLWNWGGGSATTAGKVGFDSLGAAVGAEIGGWRSLDTDGDGIPDHHDFCPRRCAAQNGTCSPDGWLSGRATDFDGDGCEDGVEDLDKDNDGVRDAIDRCPFTPQQYKFMSNAMSDFDGDGCADGLEDSDDDGDMILNFVDHCPRTLPGDSSDGRGCSGPQREEKARGDGSPPTPRPFEAVEEKREEESMSWQQEWFNLIRSAWVEVLLGAALTSVLSQITQLVGALRQQLPASQSPSGVVRRMSSSALDVASTRAQTVGRLGLRLGVYSVFFVMVYAYRASQRS